MSSRLLVLGSLITFIESSDVKSSLACIITVIVTLTILTIIIYSKSQMAKENEKKKQAVWRPLAETNQLAFITSDPSREGAFVKGNYRNYQLELFTDQVSVGNSSYLATRLELRVPHSASHSPVPKNKTSDQPVIFVQGKECDLTQAVNRLAPLLSSKDLLGDDEGIYYQGKIKLLDSAKGVFYQQSKVVTNRKFLQSLFDRLSDILDYGQPLVNLGGEIVPFLEAMAARHEHTSTVKEFIKSIAEKTTLELSQQATQLLCAYCFTECTAHQVKLSWRSSVTYYGCRNCSQSREFLPRPKHVIAVLNTVWTEPYHWQDDTFRVNWLTRRTLFDFDRIEISQASDEEVERFAVQVGNDTDPFRQPRYKQMKCTVSPECRLSENTLRILRRTFGEVTLDDVPHL
ncbi:MAG: hypothetical protein U0401_06885 [Anaerolineae bacterium]